MESKQRTPLALAIDELKDQIKKSASEKIRGGDYRIGLTKAINILESLKPKEREMLEGVWFDANQEEAKDNGNYHASKYFDNNLTQE